MSDIYTWKDESNCFEKAIKIILIIQLSTRILALNHDEKY